MHPDQVADWGSASPCLESLSGWVGHREECPLTDTSGCEAFSETIEGLICSISAEIETARGPVEAPFQGLPLGRSTGTQNLGRLEWLLLVSEEVP